MEWLYHPLYADLPPIFWGIFVFIGAAIGSFYNVLALRWGDVKRFNDAESVNHLNSDNQSASNKTLPLMAGRSHCPKCGHKIPIYHNIPLASWLLLRGRSACCSTPISPIYLLFEILGACTFLLIALTVGPTAYGLCLALLLMTLLLTTRIFMHEGFVPPGLLISNQALSMLLVLGPGVQTPGAAMVAQVSLLVVGAILVHLLRTKLPAARIAAHDGMLLGLLGLITGGMAQEALVGWIVMGAIGMAIPVNTQELIAQRLGYCSTRLFSFTSLTLLTAIASLVIFNTFRVFS